MPLLRGLTNQGVPGFTGTRNPYSRKQNDPPVKFSPTVVRQLKLVRSFLALLYL